jgi:hypothetical protein
MRRTGLIKQIVLTSTTALLFAFIGQSAAAANDYGIPGAKQRFELWRDIVADKLDKSLLPAMRNHNIDMWIVLDRENNDDPLHAELGGGFSGVRAAFVFFDNGGDTPEKIYYGSHTQPANSVIAQVYNETLYYGYSAEGLTPHLRKLVHERDPKRIGVNTSETLPDADGLTVGLSDFLVDAIGDDYARRIVSAELVVRDFRLNRTMLETAAYTDALNWTARWMREALSSENVRTGKTTNEDIAWFLEDRALELGLTSAATTRVVREGKLLPVHDPHTPLEPGDIINIDGGLHYLGFEVDIKRTAYILKSDETTMPAGLQAAWRDAQRMGALYASKSGHRSTRTLPRKATKRSGLIAGGLATNRRGLKSVSTVIPSATWRMTSAHESPPICHSPMVNACASLCRPTNGCPSNCTSTPRFPSGTATRGTRASRKPHK